MGTPQTERTTLISRKPDEAIAYNQDGEKTVGELLNEARVLAAQLTQGKYSINLHTNRYDYLQGFCAAMIAGHTTLMPPNSQSGTLDEIEQLYPASYRLGEGTDSRSQSLEAPAPIPARQSSPLIEERQPAIVAFTSGSTGKPAATVKSWHTLRVSTRHNFKALLNGITGIPNLLATVPCQHMWGFETAVLLPLLSRSTISYRSPLYPLDIATALAEIPAPRVLVSSPLHLRALLRSGVRVPGLDRILTATAPLSSAEAGEFEDYFESEVLDAFGCTESGVIATRITARESDWRLAPAFSLEPGESGTWIHADHLPEPVELPDAVELIDQHSFKWLGRNQDMVKIAGKRGSLADLNTRLLRIEGVTDGVIFHPQGAPRLAAMVVAPDLEAHEVLQALKPQIEPAFMPRPLLKVNQLPRQATGKLSQSALIDLFNSATCDRNKTSTSS